MSVGARGGAEEVGVTVATSVWTMARTRRTLGLQHTSQREVVRQPQTACMRTPSIPTQVPGMQHPCYTVPLQQKPNRSLSPPRELLPTRYCHVGASGYAVLGGWGTRAFFLTLNCSFQPQFCPLVRGACFGSGSVLLCSQSGVMVRVSCVPFRRSPPSRGQRRRPASVDALGP